MGGFLAGGAVLGGFGVVLLGLSWLAGRIRRRGIGTGLMGPFDEIWRPMAHQTQVEIREHEERRVDQADDELWLRPGPTSDPRDT